MVLKNIKEIPNGMQNIPVIEGDDLYKYLGIWQSDEIDDTFNCKTIKEKMMKKMEEINSDESSNRRYITRINTEVINIFRHSVSVVNWKGNLDKIDLEIRKYLRKAKYNGETPKIDYGTIRREYGIELKTLIHKINETKIEEIINEFIEKKKEKEVVVEIKKLLTNTSKYGSVIKLVDTSEDGSSQKE
ncbi:hypothetical protein, conserved [Entamoeba histolytica]